MSNAFQLTTTLKYFHPIKPTRKPRSRPRSVRSSNPRRLRHVRNDSTCTHTHSLATTPRHEPSSPRRTGSEKYGREGVWIREPRAGDDYDERRAPHLHRNVHFFPRAQICWRRARALPPSRWIAFYIFAARGEVKGRDEWLRGCTYTWYVEANL